MENNRAHTKHPTFLPLRLKHGLRDSRIAHGQVDAENACLALPRLVYLFHLLMWEQKRTLLREMLWRVSINNEKQSSRDLHGGAWGT